MPGAHSVSVGVWLRRGSRDEPDGLGGLLHFLEHIVFKGSQSRSAFEIAAGFDALGASVDAYTTKDQVAFTVKVLPEYFPPALALCADMLLRPGAGPRADRARAGGGLRGDPGSPGHARRIACTTPSRPTSSATTRAAGRSSARPSP